MRGKTLIAKALANKAVAEGKRVIFVGVDGVAPMRDWLDNVIEHEPAPKQIDIVAGEVKP